MRYFTTVLILFSLACSKREPATPAAGATPTESSTATTETADTPPAPAAEEGGEEERPAITLADPGAEPRRVLLRNFAGGAEETMTIRSQVTMIANMGIEGERKTVIPPIVHTVALKVQEVRSDGSAIVAFEVVGSEVLSDKEATAAIRDKMEEGAASIRGLKGTYRFDPQGVVSDVEITDAATEESRDVHMAESIGEFLYRSGVPVPSEPAGKGAKWTVKRRLKEGGILVDQTATYELEKSDGSTLVVSLDVDKSAPPQQVGSTQPFDLDFFAAEGRGRAEAQLDRLVPGLIASKTQTRIKMSAAGPSGVTVQTDLTAEAQERVSRPK